MNETSTPTTPPRRSKRLREKKKVNFQDPPEETSNHTPPKICQKTSEENPPKIPPEKTQKTSEENPPKISEEPKRKTSEELKDVKQTPKKKRKNLPTAEDITIIFLNNLLNMEDKSSKNPEKEEEDSNDSKDSNDSSNSEKSEEEKGEGPEYFLQKKDKEIKFTKIFETLDELISLGESYDPSINYICNVDIRKLHRIVESLKELNSMIGLTKFKKNIIDQLVYILTTNFSDKIEIPMLHSCIYGPPGVGKTTCSTILGKIYAECGLLTKGTFTLAKREDFVGEFLGSTALKTKKLLQSCKGGVLFIDEVYSFGSHQNDKRDSFAKEAVDTLNTFLSENYKDFICIIAGYKDAVDKCFFSQNEGLRRRFTRTYTMQAYSPEEMADIFVNDIENTAWKISVSKEILNNFFTEHIQSFPYYGGDTKTLFDQCKIIHSRKTIMLDKSLWRTLTQSDIEEGFQLYLEEREIKKEINTSYQHMFL